VLQELGIFDNAVDSLQVRGDFNGWSDSEADKSLMNQDALDPNSWFLSVPFVQTPSDENKFFKFFVKINSGIDTLWADGYERPSFHGGGNRTVTLDDETVEVYFDDIHPDWVIESDEYVDVTFSVDMRPAMDPNIQGEDLVFDPSTGDTLWYLCEQPTWAAVMGWEDSDEMKYLYFTDEDNDTIYTATLTVNSAELSQPSFNSFMYRYAFYDQSEGAWISEPSGFSNFAYRVRYIGQDAARSFPVTPWPMPIDTWTNKEIKTDQETDPYQSYQDYLETDIRDGNSGLAKQYALQQNYPNPFNPETTISFNIPIAGKVKLVVYNILGQKIKTLINTDINAGKHLFKWNGVNENGVKVPSGVYFYKIDAGKFTDIKKMVLVK
ncbi:MAG TPA: T9SS type A sorting domain-containing protein, partial [Caldithrix sp.]|nr:T9SS type A sorting domain-containing protein [Caldithrix sp.]